MLFLLVNHSSLLILFYKGNAGYATMLHRKLLIKYNPKKEQKQTVQTINGYKETYFEQNLSVLH